MFARTLTILAMIAVGLVSAAVASKANQSKIILKQNDEDCSYVSPCFEVQGKKLSDIFLRKKVKRHKKVYV